MPLPYRAEFALIAACCVWPPSPKRSRAIQAAARATLDWPLLQKIVECQRVAALVHEALVDEQVKAPAASLRALSSQAAKIGMQNLSHAAESIRLQRLLDAAGIPIMFLKGVSLAVLAYGSLALKHGKDIDLLVPESHALRALDLLEQAGYRTVLPARDMSEAQKRLVLKHDKEIVLERSDGGTQIELHWHLVSNPSLLRGVDAASPTQLVALSDAASIRTLQNDDLFTYLCVHGASHGWWRLKWLADLVAFMSPLSERDIERLYALAEQRGAGRCAGQALLLGQELLQLQLPQALAERLAADPYMRMLKNVSLRLLSGPSSELGIWSRPFATTRLSLSIYLLGRGWRYWSTELRHQILLLPDALRLGLPDRFSWLYEFYGIVRVPLWLWRKVRYHGRYGP